jgi:hypothetical protein
LVVDWDFGGKGDYLQTSFLKKLITGRFMKSMTVKFTAQDKFIVCERYLLLNNMTIKFSFKIIANLPLIPVLKEGL